MNSSTPITFSWDPSCFPSPPRYVNIALLSSQGRVFSWEDVDAFPGSFDAELDASWWGSTASIQLQVGITATDTPLFLNPFAAGPVFTAVNSNPTASSSPSASVSGMAVSASANATPTPVLSSGSVNVARMKSQGGLTGGRLAVAVLLPILVAIVAIGGYVFYVRRREAFKRAAWVETIDKRMSRLSGDWQSMSAVGGGASRPSIHSNRARSANSRSLSALGGGRPSASAEPLPNKTSMSVYSRDEKSGGPFAAEDLSQLGPRARALSEAAAAGRPISTAISVHSYNDLTVPPPLPTARSRSRSVVGMDASPNRPSFPRHSSSHGRTLSNASNNPYAPAMVQRDSQVISSDGNAVPFPPSGTSPIPRARLDSNGRSIDLAARNRVTSHVSFADAPNPNGDRRRNQSDAAVRASARNHSTADDFAIDFGDAYPALALMRVKSGEGIEFPTGETPLTPTREFLPQPAKKKTEYFDGMPNSGLGGRTPDEMLKAYASAMGNNEKGDAREQGSSTGVIGSIKKFTGLWRK